jgi:hypothetical protein
VRKKDFRDRGETLRIIGACRDCRRPVELGSYNLQYMFGQPVVCEECDKKCQR